jgi:general secretion pathway protein K
MERHIVARRAQAGYALVAVLWMVSALMLLVSALVFQARTELHTVTAGRDIAVGEARASAAIHLAARTISADVGAFSRQRVLDFEFDGEVVRVVVTPLSGLIAINFAPEQLLTALFVHGAGVDPGFAQSLAQRVIDWRDPDVASLPKGAENPEYVVAGVPFRTRGAPFEAPEDALQVLGMDLTTYDKIKDLITVEGRSARTNPLAAPPDVLVVLAQGNTTVAGRVAAARDAGQVQVDTTSLMQEFIDQSSSSRFRLKALVPISGGRTLMRASVVETAQAADSRMPWDVLRSERPQIVSGDFARRTPE